MTLLLACVFVLLHASAIFFLPAFAMQASYVFLLGAPALACVAALRRSARDGWRHSRGWMLTALAMALWTLGMLASLRQDLLLDNANAAPGDSTLLFILFGVPIVLAVSASYVEGESALLRVIDAALALALGYLFYVHTFSLLTLHGAGSMTQALLVATMFDAENLFLLVASAIRLSAADRRGERHFYRAMTVFTALYTVITFYYNHFVALGDHPDFGSLRDPLIDLAFLALAIEAWHDHEPAPHARQPSPGLVRFVRSASPLLMALALLVVAIIVLRERFYLGVAGIVVAVLGYGARTTLTQVQHIKTEEGLQQRSHAFEVMAHTDSLTGLPNRRALDEVLEHAWTQTGPDRHRITVLMIDIDYFKQLNDRCGHPAGDACLRRISEALAGAVGRRDDVLGRYGGEEFALVMSGASLQAGLVVAERLRHTVESLAISHSGSPLGVVTVSVGVASALPGEKPLDALIATADSALYEAKRRGRNQVVTLD
jgi:diguanylate cyclase (GGDEF)-like protein